MKTIVVIFSWLVIFSVQGQNTNIFNPTKFQLKDTVNVVLLFVQFADYKTNPDARGSVGSIDLDSNGTPDTLVNNKYSVTDYNNFFFSDNSYFKNPDYNDFKNTNLYELNTFGSLKDYWKTQSNGNVIIQPQHIDSNKYGIFNNVVNNQIEWITLNRVKSYCNKNNFSFMIEEAYIKALILYNEGKVKFNINKANKIIIVFAGANNVGYAATLGTWKSGIFEKQGDYTKPHQTVFGYLYGMAHEFGHLIGFPDMYDITEKTNGVGKFCVMGLNATEGRNSPSSVNPIFKLQKGWTTYNDFNQGVELNTNEIVIDKKDSCLIVIERRDFNFYDRGLTTTNLTTGILIWTYNLKTGKIGFYECDQNNQLNLKINKGTDTDYLSNVNPNSRLYNLVNEKLFSVETANVSVNETVNETINSISVYPNPFNPTNTLTVKLTFKQQITVNLYDVQGKLIKVVYNGNTNEITVTNNFNNLSSGIYFYQIVTQNKVEYKKIQLIK